MNYEEFIHLRTAGKISAGINNSVALGLIPQLPQRYQWATYFWSFIWMFSIPGFILVMIFVKWWIGLLLLIVVPTLLFSSIKRSAAQFVLEHAAEDRNFFEFLVSNELLVFKRHS